MAKDNFSIFDTPYETQPPKGAAEGPIVYGGVADVAGDARNDPMGVLPVAAKPRNIGPNSKD